MEFPSMSCRASRSRRSWCPRVAAACTLDAQMVCKRTWGRRAECLRSRAAQGVPRRGFPSVVLCLSFVPLLVSACKMYGCLRPKDLRSAEGTLDVVRVGLQVTSPRRVGGNTRKTRVQRERKQKGEAKVSMRGHPRQHLYKLRSRWCSSVWFAGGSNSPLDGGGG